jgi:hypothetical protein
MDYIILSTLVGVAVRLVVLTYDIACQWLKNLKRRMEPLPMEMHLKGLQVDCAIPSWHINRHGQSCQQNYCLGYMRGLGAPVVRKSRVAGLIQTHLPPVCMKWVQRLVMKCSMIIGMGSTFGK